MKDKNLLIKCLKSQMEKSYFNGIVKVKAGEETLCIPVAAISLEHLTIIDFSISNGGYLIPEVSKGLFEKWYKNAFTVSNLSKGIIGECLYE